MTCNWCQNEIEEARDRRQVRDNGYMHKACWNEYSDWIDECNALLQTLMPRKAKTCVNGHPFTPENRKSNSPGSKETYCIPCRKRYVANRPRKVKK